MTSSKNVDFEATKEARELALNLARRRLVLDAASRIFSRSGLDGATMRAIAAEAGCTTGAIYPLFASKEAIYATLLAESLEQLHKNVTLAVNTSNSASERLFCAGSAFLNYYKERPEEVSLGLYLWHGLQPRGLTRELNNDLNRKLDMTLDLLKEQLCELGQLSEAQGRIEAGALFSFLIGALIIHQTGRLPLFGAVLENISKTHLHATINRLKCII